MAEYNGCKICGKVVDEDDYCYGCKEFICEDHGDAMGCHSWEAHDKRFQ